MLVAIIFAFTDLVTVIIFMMVYGKQWTYKNGMLMGVHIPDYGVQDSEVAALLNAHHKKGKIFYRCNLVVSIGIAFLGLGYFSIFMTTWVLWLVEFCAGAIFLLYSSHRRLYDIKIKHNWYGGSGGKLVVADTDGNTPVSKPPYSAWWHLPVLVGGVILFILPRTREACVKYPEMWIFLWILLAIALLFIGLHISIGRVRGKVYSSSTEVNLQVNRLEKRVYSIIWLVSDYLNLAAAAVLIYMTVRQQEVVGWGLFVYIAIQTFMGISVLGGIFYLIYKRRDILACDTSPLYVDDDIYWKNGWYSNPNDKALCVQSWICEGNFEMNMARTGVKIFTFGTLGVVAALLVVMCVVFLKLDFTPVSMKVTQDSASISAPLYSFEFKRSKVLAVKLLDKLPEDSFRRSNGMSDNRQAIGEFSGKEMGPCRMYVYKKYTPILEIELTDNTIFINSRDSKNVKKWYSELAK